MTEEFTAEGKLYARLVYKGKRTWPEGVKAEFRDETWDAYTNFYHYLPPCSLPFVHQSGIQFPFCCEFFSHV